MLGDLTDFSTPEAINSLLGNLVRQLARKRIHRRDAMAIAYVSQLLLGSIASMDRHDAALRTADDNTMPQIVFERPADPTIDPASDSLKVASSFTTAPATQLQNAEGRA